MRWGFRNPDRLAGMTLIELLVVIAIIAVLASILLPLLSRSKQLSRRIACLNHLKQLSLATAGYVDQEGYYPSSNDTNEWPELLRPGYQNLKILTCPVDKTAAGSSSNPLTADQAPRSFLMNGWNDYFDSLPQPVQAEIMPENLIRQPSDTIVFGEKRSGHGDFSMDTRTRNQVDVLEQSRHGTTPAPNNGNANYAFADSSVRALKVGRSLQPENLWAVRPEARFGGP